MTHMTFFFGQFLRNCKIVNKGIRVDFCPCTNRVISQADHTPSLAFCIILQHLGGFHGLLQIGNDILGVLEADTEAEEALPVNGRIVG